MITGKFLIKITRKALSSGRQFITNAKENFRLRKEVLRLRHLTTDNTIDWDYLACLPLNERIGEFRIKSLFGRIRNMRVIFWVDENNKINKRPTIWILTVILKKDDSFKKSDISGFQQMKKVLQG